MTHLGDWQTAILRAAAAFGLLLSIACSSEPEEPTLSGEPSRSVTQGGPQDIGQFRRIVETNGVPDPELLDEVGFFAEHAVDLPEAECGHAVCVHPMLAVAPRFDGGNWSMAFVGLNTAVDPATLPERPRHLIVIAEGLNTPPDYPLPSFADVAEVIAQALSPEDRVSVVFTYSPPILGHVAEKPSAIATTEFPEWPPSSEPRPNPSPQPYEALVIAGDIARRSELSEYGHRVLWFTRGNLGGIRSPERYRGLAEDLAEAEVAITVFGMGRGYRREVPAAIADITSGNHYYAESPTDLIAAVKTEAETGFLPLARDLELSFEAAPGYRIGNVYGARRAVVSGNSARLMTPTVFIGARKGSTDVGSGRRGGGGGFFVEFLADAEPGARSPAPADVFTLTTRYEDARTGERVEQSSTLSTPLGVGQSPAPEEPFFSDPEHAKPFMMLNLYLALRAQVTLFQAGDCAGALAIEPMMAPVYDAWKSSFDDPDIDADFTLSTRLSHTISRLCARVAPAPPFDFGGGCMYPSLRFW